MENKDKTPVKIRQVIIQWICAVIWIITVIVDLICGQNLWLTVTQSIAAVGFTVSAITMTKRYRDQQDTE